MNKKVVFLVGGCLILGFALGVMVSRMATHKRIRSMIELQHPPKFKHKLMDELQLRDDQTEGFNKTFRNHMEAVGKVRRNERMKMKSEMDSLFVNLGEGLDKDQKAVLKEFESKMRRNHKKRMQKHRRE